MTKDFLIDINPDIELPKYELVLTKLTEEPITSLKNITDLEYNAFYVGIDELNFNIPFYRTEDNGDKVENEIYSLVEGDHLILINDMKYFIINSVVEKADESGKVWKEVHCYSREYELSKKKLIDYKADSRLLYDDTNSTLDGLEKGILNYIFNHIVKSWTIGYVDPDIILREGKKTYRSLNFSNSNLTQVFNDLQRTYGCVFKFDTIKQEMNIYSIDKMMGQHRGLYISDGNFIKNISKDINTDEIITRLYIYGKDNISIQSISPTGLPYIDNFNYYKNTLNKNGQPKYMTQGLIDALDNYYTKVENYNPDFEPLLIRLQEANAVMEDLINADHIDDLNQKGLVALERYLSNLQTLIDVKTEEIAIIKNQITKATGENLIGLYDDLRAIESALDSYNTDKDNVNNLIVAKKTEINNQQQIIDGIESELKALQDELNMSNSTNFTAEQLKELDKFIKVDIYNNSDYTENNIQELYDEGKKILNKASQPKIQFEVDVVDFLSLVECQHIWDKFTLGDIVTLEHKAIGFNYDVRLVGYEYNIDDNNLTLKFSNTDNFDNASLYLENLLDDFNTTGAVVDFNKDKWNNVGNIESRIAKMVDTKLEEARQNILNAVGQRYLFDDSGLWLYKENPDGTINPRQIRGINDTIALTDDNFTSVKTAITPDGINAELVRGKLGEFARIEAEQIEVGGGANPPKLTDELDRIQREAQDKIDLINGEILDVDGKISGLENFTNTAFKDGILDMAEKESLLVHIQQLNNEKTDVDAKYTSIYADANLIGVSKSALLTARNSYNTSHSALLTTINNITGDDKITGVEKTQVDNAFIDYRAKLSALSTAFENAIRAIESKKAEVIANDLIVNFNTNVLVPTISDVQTQIDGKIESWNQETDPSTVWNTADLKLKHTGDMWYKPSTKELKRYSGSVWILIEDKQAIDAYALANTKRTIFTAQPTTPYVIGDLWKVSNIAGVDFKICMTSRSSGAYVSGDWNNVNESKAYIDTQRTELNTSITGLNTTISTAFSDNSITNIEAQSISLARDSVIKEANDIKAIAVSLSVSITSLDSAISNLNTEVNKYVGKTTYPITVTATNRTALANAFTGLEGSITQLYKNIDEKRLANTSSSLTGIINGIQTDLQTQIDGKIDTWFYAVEPTLSNAPASSWTTNAIKDKHIDDLYYDTVKGYAYRFTKVSTVYSWSRIMDSDITKALSDASVAKSTADGKMTVYIVQPTTPYHKGDLWRETANATDLKICTTARASGLYTAGDWSDATNVSGALSGLQGSINDFSSDLKLTLAEANGLKTSLESVTSESLELVSTATTLGITTEKTNYSTSLTTLANYLNTNWLGKIYPLTITVAQRTNVTNYFKDLENKKSILLTKITEVREERANSYTDGEISSTKTEFKVTTDAISSKVSGVEADASGLKTRMTSAENKITDEAIIGTVEEKVSTGTTSIARKSDVTQEVDKYMLKFDYLKEPLKARYLRTTITLRNDSITAFSEIEVYDKNGTNLALNRPTTSNRTPIRNFETEYYVDGNVGNHCMFSKLPSGSSTYIRVDLGAIKDIVSIKNQAFADPLPYDYKLEASTNGSTWTVLGLDTSTQSLVHTHAFTGFQQGITTINGDGIKVEHSGTNEYSMVKADGFVRKYQYGEARYLNDIYSLFIRADKQWLPSKPEPLKASLPASFYKRANTELVLIPHPPTQYQLPIDDLIHYYLYYDTTCSIISSHFGYREPVVTIEAYSHIRAIDSDANPTLNRYYPLDVHLLAIGK